jgi:hypothetical protein
MFLEVVMMKKVLSFLVVSLLLSSVASAAVIFVDGTTGTSTDVALAAGWWKVTPIANPNDYDAWTAWSYIKLPIKGWMNTYDISSTELGTLNEGDNIRYATDAEALAAATSVIFELTAADTVSFLITDSPLSDNKGGMTLRITESRAPSTVPAPGALLLGALGTGIVTLIRKRRIA